MTRTLTVISLLISLIFHSESRTETPREAFNNNRKTLPIIFLQFKNYKMQDITLKVSITSDVSEAADSEALAPLISSRDLTAILGRSGLWIIIRD